MGLFRLKLLHVRLSVRHPLPHEGMESMKSMNQMAPEMMKAMKQMRQWPQKR